MNAIQTFFSMGGYAAYVWPAYAIVFIGMIGNMFYISRDRKKIQAKLQKMIMIQDLNDAD